MEQNPMQKSIDEIDHTQQHMDKQATDKEEPGYILYTSILETSKEILQSPVFVESFQKIAERLGKEETRALTTMMSLAMTHSAYNAIQLYDTLMTQQLNKTVENFNSTLSELAGTVNGHQGALEVFKKRLDTIEEKLKSR